MVAEATFPSTPVPAWPGRVTHFGSWAIGLGAVLLAVSGPLNRYTPLNVPFAVPLLAAGVIVLLVGTPLALVGLLAALAKRAPAARGLALLAVAASLALLAYLFAWLRAGLAAPPIPEISTDLATPPPFVELVRLRARAGALHPPGYVAEIVGRRQRLNVAATQVRAYPDIQPAWLEGVPPSQAFARAAGVAQALGWRIVASVPEEGRIEATDTSRFFGFQDDIVIRLRAEAGGTRIDLRSKSRVGFGYGLGDVGGNSARVRRFLARLEAAP